MGVSKEHLGKWRSIEFECWFVNEKAKDEFMDFIAKNKYGAQVEIGDDGSIEPDDEDSDVKCDCYTARTFGQGNCDHVSPITAEIKVSFVAGRETIVRKVCAFLKGRAKVNASCGTHVHFDMRHVDPGLVRVYGAKLACAIPALKMLLPKSRRKNEYCEADLNSLNADVDYDDRYAFINLQAYSKYKTLEVRGHSGTLNADKILNWIKLCEKIMFSSVAKTIKTPKELCKTHKLSKNLSAYIIRRAKEVNKASSVEI